MGATPQHGHALRKLRESRDTGSRNTLRESLSNLRSHRRHLLERQHSRQSRAVHGSGGVEDDIIGDQKSGVLEPNKPWWIIDPRQSTLIGYWDTMASIALIYTALVTPVEVSFLNPATGDERYNTLFFINRVIDAVFLMDMVLQFFLGFALEDPVQGLRWVFAPRAIVRNYVCSKWFMLDAVSVGSSVFDLMPAGDLSELTTLRAVRVMRLTKLVRIFRGSRVFKRWEMRVTIDYTLLTLSQTLIAILVVVHWMACIWGLQASFYPLDSWMGASRDGMVDGGSAYCEPWGSGIEDEMLDPSYLVDNCPHERWCDMGVCADGKCVGGYACVPAWPMYVNSIYWSTMTITSVGFGDIIARPMNIAEQVVCSLMMLFGGMLWGNLIGVFCSIASNLSPTTNAFRKELSELNHFMHTNHLEHKLRFQLREYLHQAVHMKNARAQSRILSSLSPALHSHVMWKINERWVASVWFLRETEQEFKISVAHHLVARVFPPEEICPRGVLYIVKKGVALCNGKVVQDGGCWGEDILLKHEGLRQLHFGIAIHYLWVFTLEGGAIHECLKQHPHSKHVVDKYFARLAICLVVLQAKRKRERALREMNGAAGAARGQHQALLQDRTPPLARSNTKRWLTRTPTRTSCSRRSISSNERRLSLIAAQNFSAEDETRRVVQETDEQRIVSMQRQLAQLEQSQQAMLQMMARLLGDPQAAPSAMEGFSPDEVKRAAEAALAGQLQLRRRSSTSTSLSEKSGKRVLIRSPMLSLEA